MCTWKKFHYDLAKSLFKISSPYTVAVVETRLVKLEPSKPIHRLLCYYVCQTEFVSYSFTNVLMTSQSVGLYSHQQIQKKDGQRL